MAVEKTLKYVGLPSPNRVDKKRAGQKIFLMFLVTNMLCLLGLPWRAK